MISVKEALDISLSETLTKDEQKVYNDIVNFIDYKIKDNFDGQKITFKLTGEYIGGNTFSLSNAISKEWRRNIVMNKWKNGYRNLCWRIEENSDGYGKIYYTFSVDPSYTRDERLNQIGIK